MRVSLIVGVLFVALGSQAAVDQQKASAFVLCKNQKNVRTIRVTPDKKSNCTVTYSKGGSEEVVGSNRDLKSCKSIVESVKDTLEDSKWKCREVGTATVTTSSEVSRQ